MDVFHHIPLSLQTFMFNLTPPPFFLHLALSSATVLQICDLYESHIIRSVSALMSRTPLWPALERNEKKNPTKL